MKEKVLVLGLSKSGVAASILAVNKGYDVYITESKKEDEIREEFRSLITNLKAQGIKIECGGHSEEFIEGSSFAVSSPGIPPKSEIFQRLNNKNIKISNIIYFKTSFL